MLNSRKGPFDSEDDFSSSESIEESDDETGPPTKKHKSTETQEEEETLGNGNIQMSSEVEDFYASMMSKSKPAPSPVVVPKPAASSIPAPSSTGLDSTIQKGAGSTSTVEQPKAEPKPKAEENPNDPLAFFAMMKKNTSSTTQPISVSMESKSVLEVPSQPAPASQKLAIPSSWLSPSTPTSVATSSQTTSTLSNGPEKVLIKETYEYAGEQVTVERKVDANQVAAIASKKGSSGLGSLLDQLKGKNKISSIQKSKLDWNSFTEVEGLEDEFEQNKKDGYLQKQEFLHQADLAQFEQEKTVRSKERSKRGL